MSVDLDILGIGLSAPGLSDWECFQSVLNGKTIDIDSKAKPSTLLSARERRRAPAAVKLTFPAAEQACAMAGIDPADPLAVFSSGMGDLDITNYMCRTLADQPELLSPTRFHNSVHNAASGYWSIGAGARGDVTAISAWRDSATLGLLEGITRTETDALTHSAPVLVVIYDDHAIGPMHDLWPSDSAFCAALLLAPPNRGETMARLTIELCQDQPRHAPLPASLAARIDDNPAARIIPLLALIADPARGDLVLGAEQGPALKIRRSSTGSAIGTEQ